MTKYILNKDCYNINKEVGDYYNGEYGESEEKIEELIKKGIIVPEYDCEFCQDTGEISLDETDESGNVSSGTLKDKCVCTLEDQDIWENNDQDR